MYKKRELITKTLYCELVKIISETNGINLHDTLELLSHSESIKENPPLEKALNEFIKLLGSFQINEVDIETLLGHPVSDSLFLFFENFPLQYHEEHIHLTGSLAADFIYPRLKKLLKSKNKSIFEKKIIEVYGKEALPIESVEDVDDLIRLKDGEQFSRYLEILYLAKLILRTKKDHEDAAYHMASELYNKYNVVWIDS